MRGARGAPQPQYLPRLKKAILIYFVIVTTVIDGSVGSISGLSLVPETGAGGKMVRHGKLRRYTLISNSIHTQLRIDAHHLARSSQEETHHACCHRTFPGTAVLPGA